MTNTQVSIAPITAGKPTLNVNDVLNKYIPNVNESEFPQYIFQTTAGPQYTNVSVYSADNSRLLFSFRDIYGTNLIYFNRLYGLFVFKFEIIDKNLKLISKTKNIPNLKSISAAKPESNLNLDFGVVDIETFVKRPEDESGDNKVIPYAIGVYYKGEFKSFYLSDYAETPTRLNEMFDDFIDYITDKNIKTLYAHNGGKFDFWLILKYIKKGVHHKSLVRKSTIYTFSIKNKGLVITFCDSYLMLPFGLRKLCIDFQSEVLKGYYPHWLVTNDSLEYIGVKPPHDVTKCTIEEYNLIPDNLNLKSDCIKYLEADCIGLHNVLTTFANKVYKICRLNPLKSNTISSFSNRVWRLLDADMVPSVKSYVRNTTIYKDIRSAYYGGITEVMVPHVKEGSAYDVNSIYPSVMADIKMPIGEPILKDSKNLDDYYGFCYAKIKTNNQAKGLLPYRLYGMLVTPNGSWEGWYYSEELKKARSLGYDISVTMGYHYELRGFIFPKFISTFFNLKNDTDSAYRAIGKMILNSAYGYLGLNYSDTYSMLAYDVNNIDELNPEKSTDNYRIVEDKNDMENQPFDRKTSIAIAAIITAESRMKVLDIRIHERAAYTDTDSVILIGKEPLENMDVDSKKLGSWKFEGHIKDGIFIGKKIYAYWREDVQVVKVAGAPKGLFSWDNICQVYKNNLEFQRVYNRLKLDKANLNVTSVDAKVTLKNNDTGIIKIYENVDNNYIHVGSLPLIINVSKDDFNKTYIKNYKPVDRLLVKPHTTNIHFSYEESVRYPTNIKGVELPYDLVGEWKDTSLPEVITKYNKVIKINEEVLEAKETLGVKDIK